MIGTDDKWLRIPRGVSITNRYFVPTKMWVRKKKTWRSKCFNTYLGWIIALPWHDVSKKNDFFYGNLWNRTSPCVFCTFLFVLKKLRLEVFLCKVKGNLFMAFANGTINFPPWSTLYALCRGTILCTTVRQLFIVEYVHRRILMWGGIQWHLVAELPCKTTGKTGVSAALYILYRTRLHELAKRC